MIDKETAIVMCYTGWPKETALSAISQWQRLSPGWSAEYMKECLSARDLEKLERLTTEASNADEGAP